MENREIMEKEKVMEQFRQIIKSLNYIEWKRLMRITDRVYEYEKRSSTKFMTIPNATKYLKAKFEDLL